MQESRKPGDPGSRTPSIRRDDRAEPDDPAPAGRIDVVNVERGENSAVAAMLTLRRELTRLTAQATAVERSLEDQRRERSEAIERLQSAEDRATAAETHALTQEARAATLEKELEGVRRIHEAALAELRSVIDERDALAQSLEGTKALAEELRARDEAARRAEDAASKLTEELDVLRRRVTALEVGNEGLRVEAAEEAKRSLDKDIAVAQWREQHGRLERELERTKMEGGEAVEAAQREAAATKEKLAELEATLAEARAETARANDAAADAERRAMEEKISRAAIEQAVFKLRDEVLGAFSHLEPEQTQEAAAADPLEAPAPVPPTRALPTDARSPDEPFDDDGWPSNPPPDRESAPPVTIASPSVRPKSMRPEASAEMLASLHRGSLPDAAAAAYQVSGTKPPPTRRHDVASARQELFDRLGDPVRAPDALAELREHPEWLKSVPPPALVTALASVDYDVDNPVFDLARAWEREPLCHALVTSVRSASDERIREHGAWLLKHLAAASQWKALADLARSDAEAPQVRRWLLEALDRLAAGRTVGWSELGDLVVAMASHPDPTLRDGVVGILMSLERSDEKKKILVDMLRAEEDEAVLLSVLHALGSVLPVDLEATVIERLIDHPSARVQRSARDLVERSKQSSI